MALFYYALPRTHSVVLPWGGEQVELRGRWIIGSRWDIKGQRRWQLRGGGEHASGSSADGSHLSIFILALRCLCHWALREHQCSESQKPILRHFTSMTNTNNTQILPSGLTEGGLQQLSTVKAEILPHYKCVDFRGMSEKIIKEKQPPGSRLILSCNTFYTFLLLPQ